MNLEARLRERIRREGPISFYEWMKAALYDEREGYYAASRVRQGRAGDYRTAPETSPLFAATFAAYFAKLFAKLDSPSPFTIVEFGAGSGEFAYGVLTTLRSEHPKVFSAANYVIEEVSASSRELCAERLSEFSDRVNVTSSTVTESSLAEAVRSRDLTPGTITGVVFSNELVDAFPVNRIAMRDGHLRQLYVGVDEDTFIWIEREPEPAVAEYCERIRLKLDDGQSFEINLDAETFIARAAGLLDRGYVITVDYGAERVHLLQDQHRRLGTLRAFRRHQFADNVLGKPGEQDLTTTIDWTQLIEAGEHAGLRTTRFEQLDKFLIAEGLVDRLNAATQPVTNSAEAVRLTTSARELISPAGMATSFQVLVQEKTQ